MASRNKKSKSVEPSLSPTAQRRQSQSPRAPRKGIERRRKPSIESRTASPIVIDTATNLRTHASIAGGCRRWDDSAVLRDASARRGRGCRRGTGPSRVLGPSSTQSSRGLYGLRRSGGEPLPTDTRELMESRWATASHRCECITTKRPHRSPSGSGPRRSRSEPTWWSFGSGQYQPHSASGQRLLAHELVHTLQQGTGAGVMQRAPEDDVTASKRPAACPATARSRIGAPISTKE